MAQKLFDKASLVMIPSQYKEGKVYNIKPEDQSSSFEFERGSAATRVNSDGFIETLHNEATNLLLQSNQFDTTWSDINASVTGGQTGYDGSSDAWSFFRDGTGGSVYLVSNSTGSGVSTFSIYAKAGDTHYLAVQDVGTSSAYAIYDVSVGNPTSGSVTTSSGSIIEKKIELVSGSSDWYRISFTANRNTSGVYRIYASSDTSLVSPSNAQIYIQDAQLESGYFATPYIETTTEAVTRPNRHDTPRLDYSGTEPALLLEPQRTNEVVESELISEANVVVRVNFEDNSTLSPDGLNNATKIIPTTENNSHFFSFSDFNSNIDGYTQSIYVKSSGYNYVYILLNSNAYTPNTVGGIWFDIQNGVKGSATVPNSGYNIEAIGSDGWYRIYATHETNGTATPAYLGVSEVDGVKSFAGDGTKGVYVYGAQLEQGSYATSYIPTNGQAETRIFESFDNKSLEDYLKTVDTTFFLEFNNDNPREGSTSICRIYSGADFFGIKGISGTSPYLQVTGFTADFSGVINIADSINNTKHKVILRVTENLIEVFYNGAKLTDTITRSSTNIWDRLFTSAQGYLQKINGITIFDTSLSDQECINLTTI